MGGARTTAIAKNATYSMVCHLLTLLMQFVVRTIFIRYLNIEYLGINGLFTNVLTILSFAELGIGNAIVFSLYKPLAVRDNYKVAQLMQLYKKTYIIIAIIVLVLGCFLLPFLNVFIKCKPNINEDLNVIYLVFVLNTAISYLFVYKQSLIIADQKKYIITFYTLIIAIIFSFFQSISLILFKSFHLYLVLMLFSTIVTNVFISQKCNRLYPNITKRDVDKLSQNETKDIFLNVKSMCVYRFGGVILNSTSNIFISKIFGVAVLGICSNFIYITSAVNTLLSQILLSLTPSIGNLNAIESIEHKRVTFYKTTVICFWLYGFVCSGLMAFFNEFISIWIGEKYTIDSLIILSIVLVVYIDNAGFSLYTYRITLGLFRKGKYSPIIASVVSVLLTLLLSHKIGVAGVFFAVSIARFLVINMTDVYLVFKYGLKSKPMKFFCYYVSFTLFTVIACMLGRYICNDIITDNPYLTFILRVAFYSIFYNVLFISIFWRNKSLKSLVANIKSLMSKS